VKGKVKMLTHRIGQPSHVKSNIRNGSTEMSRLVNAALVDSKFCALLLTDPSVALVQGYNNEVFHLTPKEMSFVITSRATSLTDFADLWVRMEKMN